MLDVLAGLGPFHVEFFGPFPPFGMLASVFAFVLVFSTVMDIALGNKKVVTMILIPVNLLLWTFLFPTLSGFIGSGQSAEIGAVVTMLGKQSMMLVTFVAAWWVLEALALGLTTIVFRPFGAEFDAKFDAWVTSPVLEELGFRYVLFSMLVNAGAGVGVAIVGQAMLYSLSQIKNGIMGGLEKWMGLDNMLHTFLLGLCLGLIAVEYGLIYALILNMVFDIVFDVIQVFTPSGE